MRHPLSIDLMRYAEGKMLPLPALGVMVHVAECQWCRLAVMRMQDSLKRAD